MPFISPSEAKNAYFMSGEEKIVKSGCFSAKMQF